MDQEVGYVSTDGDGKYKSCANPEWSWEEGYEELGLEVGFSKITYNKTELQLHDGKSKFIHTNGWQPLIRTVFLKCMCSP